MSMHIRLPVAMPLPDGPGPLGTRVPPSPAGLMRSE